MSAHADNEIMERQTLSESRELSSECDAHMHDCMQCPACIATYWMKEGTYMWAGWYGHEHTGY